MKSVLEEKEIEIKQKKEKREKKKYRALVVEQSRASKSDNLVILKVEGSNPGSSIFFAL